MPEVSVQVTVDVKCVDKQKPENLGERHTLQKECQGKEGERDECVWWTGRETLLLQYIGCWKLSSTGYAELTVGEKGKLEEIPCGVDKGRSQSIGGRSGFWEAKFPLYQEGLSKGVLYVPHLSQTANFFFFVPAFFILVQRFNASSLS